MPVIEKQITYRCLDDCEWSGCPGHVGILRYQSVSGAYSFDIGGQIVLLDHGKMQAIVDLLRSLDRSDSVQVGMT